MGQHFFWRGSRLPCPFLSFITNIVFFLIQFLILNIRIYCTTFIMIAILCIKNLCTLLMTPNFVGKTCQCFGNLPAEDVCISSKLIHPEFWQFLSSARLSFTSSCSCVHTQCVWSNFPFGWSISAWTSKTAETSLKFLAIKKPDNKSNKNLNTLIISDRLTAVAPADHRGSKKWSDFSRWIRLSPVDRRL